MEYLNVASLFQGADGKAILSLDPEPAGAGEVSLPAIFLVGTES